MRPDNRPVVKGEPRGFHELAKAHVATHGGEWFVIDRDDRAQAHQRRAWLAYFAWLDDQTYPRGTKARAFASLRSLTVPTAWPLEFDASAPPAPMPDQPEPFVGIERRLQLGRMLRESVGGVEAPRRRAGDASDARDAHQPNRLDELAEEYRRVPPIVTGRLAIDEPAKSSENRVGLPLG